MSWCELNLYMQATLCLEFKNSLRYNVTLLGKGNAVLVKDSSCGQVCTTTFRGFANTSVPDGYTLSLHAVNPVGSSEAINYPTTISKYRFSTSFANLRAPHFSVWEITCNVSSLIITAQQSQFYFTPTIVSTDCVFTGKCFSNGSIGTSDCNVSYTTDSTYNNTTTTLVSPLNTLFEITGLTSDTLYYFEFTVLVNDTLLVSNRISERTMSSKYMYIAWCSNCLFGYIQVGRLMYYT